MDNKQLTNRYMDYSGGVQTITSRLLQKDNELSKAINARYDSIIGGVTRRKGYEIVGFPVEDGNRMNGANSFFQKDGNNKLLVVCDNTADTYGTIRHEAIPYWTNIYTTLPKGAKTYFENFMDMAFVAGYSESTDSYIQTMTIDGSKNTSTSINVYNAPRGKFISKFGDQIYITNCWVNGKRYPNRTYASSSPTDAITFVNGDYSGMCWQIEVDSARYLKAGMVIDIYGENSDTKKLDSLTIISVDKGNNAITFTPQIITLSDRDGVYLEDKKGTLGIFWNIDYPNPESADFLEIPPIASEVPSITAVSSNNNRKLLFTSHSMWKWDSANLVNISKTIGTKSPDSVKEISGWTVFLDQRGNLQGFNDSNGQLQLLSKGVQKYINAINQVNLPDAVATVVGDIYKVCVGTLATLDLRTTSTSTSSTSTSSTSSSTSSTSTSSTSTSTSTSTVTATTTSTSSTSTSTSVTTTSISSSSSSSTSVSTSSTSTSTTTTTSTTKVYEFVYDFSSNTWATDTINRNKTCSVLHTMHGYEKAYFGDDTGRFYRDDTSLTDNGVPIQFLIETKRANQDLPEETKTYRRVYVYTQDGQGAIVSYSVDGEEWQALGQLNKNVTSFELRDIQGRDIALMVSQNNGGEAVVFIGWSLIWFRGNLDATK